MSKLEKVQTPLKVLLKGHLVFIMVVAVFASTIAFAQKADNQQQKASEQNEQAVVSKHDDASAKELYATVKKPTTPIELLKNIKFALDHELLLRDDFYTDENLMQFFGGSQVRWDSNRPGLRQATVTVLGEPLEDRFEYYGGRFRRMKIDATLQTVDENNRYVEGGKRLQGFIILNPAGDSRFTIETVKSVFGEPAEVFNPYAGENPLHPTKLGPKTHPLGHMAFRYKFDYPRLKVKVGFSSNGNGTLKIFNAGLEEVK